MKSSRYILPVSAIVVAAALAVLVLKVRATPAIDIDDKKLAMAEAMYKRRADGDSPVAATESVRSRTRTKPVRATPRVNTAPPPPTEPDQPDPTPEDRTEPTIHVAQSPDVELKAKMDAANKAYDRGDYPTAEDAAFEILKDNPRNLRMLRIVVSTSCMMGNPEQAAQYVNKLPNRDQTQMRTRCSRWGVELPAEE